MESGDLLRDAMLAAAPPVDVYTAWGKVTNCSGGGAPQQRDFATVACKAKSASLHLEWSMTLLQLLC